MTTPPDEVRIETSCEHPLTSQETPTAEKNIENPESTRKEDENTVDKRSFQIMQFNVDIMLQSSQFGSTAIHTSIMSSDLDRQDRKSKVWIVCVLERDFR